MAMNDSQLITDADIIKNETAPGANTATRVGTMLDNIILNKINNDKIDVDGTLAANSDTLVASQKATKTYVGTQINAAVTTINGTITSGLALKENTGNKSNGPLGTSSVLFPTENSVATALVPKENTADKTISSAQLISNGTSTIKYPSIKSVKDYVDGVATGLLRDNGNYDPTVTSQYPTSADTLSGGTVQVGDLWYIGVPGTMNGNSVLAGYSVRALITGAGPTTDADWAIANVGLGFIPEDSANKSDDGTFNAGSPDHDLFPTQFAVATYLANNTPAPTLQDVLTNGHTLVNGNNFQGTLAGADMAAPQFQINAFGEQAARFNSGDNINAFGLLAGGSANLLTPNGDNINAFGYSAAYNTTGGDVNAFGYGSAKDSTGYSVNSMGYLSAELNTGSNVNAFGTAAAANNTGSYVNALGLNAGFGNTYSNVTLLGQLATASADNQLVIAGDNGGPVNAQISVNGLTADRLYTLPDQAGTIALLSDLENGVKNITVDINQAQLIAGGGVEIIPAQGANKIIHVISGSSVLISTAPFSTVPSVFVTLQYSPTFVQIGYALAIDVVSKFSTFIMNGQNNPIASFNNLPVQVNIPSGLAGGSNILRVSLQYIVINAA